MSNSQNYPHPYADSYAQATAALAQDKYAQQANTPKSEGIFTQRIRSMAGHAEELEYRLRSLLRTLRVPPPEPGMISGSSGAGINAVHTTIEEQLGRHEVTQGNISALISELEGLLA